jgi:hypothetical protein
MAGKESGGNSVNATRLSTACCRDLPRNATNLTALRVISSCPPYLIDIVQNGAEPTDVPLLERGVGEGAAEVGSVGGGYERDVLPVLPLQVLVVRVRRRLISRNLTGRK